MAEPEEDAAPGVPEWVVTYGDMMSLLLTFFIMLVSMSQLKSDDGKVRAMMDAIRQAFGPTLGAAGVPGTSMQSTSALNKRGSTGNRSEGGVKKAARETEKGGGGAHTSVERISHGTVVTLGGPAMFGRFDATLSEELKRNLDVIAELVAKKPNRIVVRGHASPEPLPADRKLVFRGIEIRDQMDLSYARADAVADYLAKRGIDRVRLVVSAAGKSEPRRPTRRSEGRQMNRRVDVFLLDSYTTRPRRGEAAGS